MEYKISTKNKQEADRKLQQNLNYRKKLTIYNKSSVKLVD